MVKVTKLIPDEVLPASLSPIGETMDIVLESWKKKGSGTRRDHAHTTGEAEAWRKKAPTDEVRRVRIVEYRAGGSERSES